MKFNTITLCNIGPYAGEAKFDFKTEQQNKVILIGGKNGAGKTTLLNSIKIGLFGSYSFGYKSDNKEYFSRINRLLNNDAKQSRVGESFKITIDFNMPDGFYDKNYIITRGWKYEAARHNEYFQVKTEGRYLNGEEMASFQTKIREYLPPELLDFTLFDGEEIAKIVSQDELPKYLRALSKVVFKLNWFESLEEDLDTYSSQAVSSNDQNQKDLQQALERQRILRKNSLEIKTQKEEVQSILQSTEEEISYFKSEFEKNGGLVKAEREKLLSEIQQREIRRKVLSEDVRNYVSNVLPFQLAVPLLLDAQKQIADEESVHFITKLEKMLGEGELASILSSLDVEEAGSKQEILKNALISSLKSEQDTSIIHGASFSESSQIEQTIITLKSNTTISVQEKIAESNEKLQELKKLRESLKINDSTSEFNDMLAEIEVLQKRSGEAKEQWFSLEKEYQQVEKELNSVTNTVDKLELQILNDSKASQSFKEARKIIKLSEKFREVQLLKKIHQVQREALGMLNQLLRKKDYISSVKIDPQTFDVQLEGNDELIINKTTLSSGEKQMLLISLVWAMFKSSDKELPFIFDTLLGRLDKDHKRAILTKFIPKAGTQAIVLSTDSEIDKEYYDLLAPYIAKEYTLLFSVDTNSTTLLHDYLPMLAEGIEK